MKVTNTSARLKELLASRNIKQIDIIESTGISKGALSSYISGRYEPKQDNIYLLAHYFGVSEAWLMGYDVPIEKPAADQSDSNRTRLLSYYDSFNQAGKAELLRYARLMDKDDSYKKGLSDSLEDRMA